jgi:hypothetical protein
MYNRNLDTETIRQLQELLAKLERVSQDVRGSFYGYDDAPLSSYQKLLAGLDDEIVSFLKNTAYKPLDK